MRDTIKKHEDFAAGDNDPVAKSPYFLIRAKRAKIQNDARYGLIVTKKLLNMQLIEIGQNVCCVIGLLLMKIC